MAFEDASLSGTTHSGLRGYYTENGTDLSRGDFLRAAFDLRADVHLNVKALREYLGSAERELSLGGLARLLNEADGRSRSASTIQRWEEGAEPDYGSTRLMAEMAGVSFEAFALGVAEPAAAQKRRPAPPTAQGFTPAPRSKTGAQRRKSG
jgi:hypothetical protein